MFISINIYTIFYIMPVSFIDHDYVCMMKQPVLCELCNKSYAIGVMKKHV